MRQMLDRIVDFLCFFRQNGLEGIGGAIAQKGLDIRNRDVQLPEHQNGFKNGALLAGIIPIAIFPNDCRLEQADFVVPHQRLFIKATPHNGVRRFGERF